MEWEDITDACKAASLVLNDSVPFVATNYFSLYDAMSAVELMDEKMDPCYGMTRPYRFEDVVRSCVPCDMSEEVSLAVLSQLLTREVSFLDGASLIESINQCVFVWPDAWSVPTSSSGEVVMYYGRELVRSLSDVVRGVLDADIFEDEDYQHTSRPSAENLSTTATASKVSADLQLFVNLRQALNVLYSLISRHIAKYARKPIVERTVLLSEMQDMLGAIRAVEHCVVELQQRQFSFADVPHMDTMFSKKILHILQVAPTRNIAFLSFRASLDYILTMCIQLTSITDFFCAIHSRETCNYMELLVFLKQQSALSASSVLVRSLLFAYLCTLPIVNAFEKMLRQYYVPESMLNSSQVTKWIQAVVPILFEGLKLFAVCRTKMLARLAHLLDKFVMLVRDAATLDMMLKESTEAEVHNRTCQWFYVSMTSLLTFFMDLNFELTVEMNLLHASEIAYFYWYWDHVLATRVWTLQQLRELDYRERSAHHSNDIKQAEDSVAQAKTQSSSKRKKAEQHLSKLKTQAVQPSDASIEELQWNLKSTLCRGYYHMFVVFNELHVITVADLPYCDIATKFGNRFRCFQGIDVPNLAQHYGDYSAYVASLKVGSVMNYTEIVTSIINLFKKCKLFLDRMKQLGITSVNEEMSYVKV